MAGQALQIFSDGGFKEGIGAAAFVVVVINAMETNVEERIAIGGFAGKYFPEAKSASQMELIAAEMGINYARQVKVIIPS